MKIEIIQENCMDPFKNQENYIKIMKTIVMLQKLKKIQTIQENYSEPSENSNNLGQLCLAFKNNHENPNNPRKNCVRPSRNLYRPLKNTVTF
jgi:hypothetical protein